MHENRDGDVIVVRYADDNVVGFQHRSDADRFLEALRERLGKFGLEIHPDKTQLIEFGRLVAQRRQQRREEKPETFDFLGFTHISAEDRNGNFVVRRQTIGKRLRSKLEEIKQKLRQRMHEPPALTGKWLKSVVQGYWLFQLPCGAGQYGQPPRVPLSGNPALAANLNPPEPAALPELGANASTSKLSRRFC